jgi:hypothetical protein
MRDAWSYMLVTLLDRSQSFLQVMGLERALEGEQHRLYDIEEIQVKQKYRINVPSCVD